MEKLLPPEDRQRSSGVLLMSAGERKRSYQMRRLANKVLSQGEATVLLNISTHQCRRLYKRWRQFGDNGLISGHRSRESNNRQDEMRATCILMIAPIQSTRAIVFMRQPASVSAPISARRWLSAAGYWQSQPKKASLPHPPVPVV